MSEHKQPECDRSARHVLHKQHECNTSVTRVQHESYKSDRSATRVKNFDFDNETNKKIFSHPIFTICQVKDYKERNNFILRTTRTTRVRHEWKLLILTMKRIKIYFHTPIFTIWQVKDYRKRNNFILKTTFWICLVPLPKCVWKVHQKNVTSEWQKIHQKVIH